MTLAKSSFPSDFFAKMNKGSDISDLTTKVPNPHLYLLFLGGGSLSGRGLRDLCGRRDLWGLSSLRGLRGLGGVRGLTTLGGPLVPWGGYGAYGVWEGFVVLQPWGALGPLGGSEAELPLSFQSFQNSRKDPFILSKKDF